MKKVLQLLVVPAFMLGTFIWVSSPSAQAIACDEMSISETGPSSENIILCQDETSITIQCSNNTIITVDLNQDASSGNAGVEGNTNGGSAQSGDSENESNVEVDIDNICATAETEEEPETPVTPVTPTQTPTATPAATTPVTVSTEKKPTVAALPNTGEMNLLAVSTAAAASIVAIFTVAKIASTIYASRS